MIETRYHFCFNLLLINQPQPLPFYGNLLISRRRGEPGVQVLEVGLLRTFRHELVPSQPVPRTSPEPQHLGRECGQIDGQIMLGAHRQAHRLRLAARQREGETPAGSSRPEPSRAGRGR